MSRVVSFHDAALERVAEVRIDALRGPDAAESRLLGAAVGENVARWRARRGLDLDDVAERSGIEPDRLALLEAGQAVPSLRAVWALAGALEVPFGVLLGRVGMVGSSFRVQRANRGRVVASTSARIRSRVLFPLGDPHAPEVYELTLAPGCFEGADGHGRTVFEHITVVRGLLVVQTDENLARLAPGDSLFFRADSPHSYRNPTSGETVVHLVMTYGQYAG